MNYIKFLGTAGARFVMIKQIRCSAGLWLSADNTNIIIDPGPGSLVRCLSSKPALQPPTLDGIILTHRHLDHANDVNIMIEAMTNGGYTPKGIVLAPQDALENDPVILHYLRSYVKHIQPIQPKQQYTIGSIHITAPIQHQHGTETYGLNIKTSTKTLSLITDTEYFQGLENYYPGEILIINVVLHTKKQGIQHLCIDDIQHIVTTNKPKLCVLTHFGMTMIKAKPWKIAEELTKTTGVNVLAATDGMLLPLNK